MSTELLTCHPGTTVHELEAKMQKAQIRRVPVIDSAGILVGIVTLADLAQAAQLSSTPLDELPRVALTLSKITRPRSFRAPTDAVRDALSLA